MMRIQSIFLCALMAVALPPARAAEETVRRCVVVDPARGALTVRATPAGGNAGRLRNGASVEMLDIAYDDKDRAWARVRTTGDGTPAISGWVFRAFLECD